MNSIDYSLINVTRALAVREQKIREYSGRFRRKGRVLSVDLTDKGNINLTFESEDGIHTVTVLKSHKERYDLAFSLQPKTHVYVEGIRKLKIIICTKLRKLGRWVLNEKQETLGDYVR